MNTSDIIQSLDKHNRERVIALKELRSTILQKRAETDSAFADMFGRLNDFRLDILADYDAMDGLIKQQLTMADGSNSHEPPAKRLTSRSTQ